MIRRLGAHWPTKLPSCFLPLATSAAEAAIALTASPSQIIDGALAVCCSTEDVRFPSRCMQNLLFPPARREIADRAAHGQGVGQGRPVNCAVEQKHEGPVRCEQGLLLPSSLKHELGALAASAPPPAPAARKAAG